MVRENKVAATADARAVIGAALLTSLFVLRLLVALDG